MINRTYSTYNYPSLEKKFKAPKSTQKISFYGNIGELPIYLFFFLIGIHSMQGWTATTRHRVTRKTSTKRLEHIGNLFRRNLQLKDVY